MPAQFASTEQCICCANRVLLPFDGTSVRARFNSALRCMERHSMERV